MEKLVGLPATFEREKSLFARLEQSKSGPVLFKVVSRHTGRVTYQVGHIQVEPAHAHELSGVVTPASEVFVADESYDNDNDARQAMVRAVMHAERAATEGFQSLPGLSRMRSRASGGASPVRRRLSIPSRALPASQPIRRQSDIDGIFQSLPGPPRLCSPFNPSKGSPSIVPDRGYASP